MAEDTPNTESADDQVDVGRAVSEQMGCSFAFFFFGIATLTGGIFLLSLIV
jgi:hypothetical protein